MSALKRWHQFVRGFGCVICCSPASIHHPRGGSVAGEASAGRKSSEAGVIPLCHYHHQGAEGIHHLGVETWEAKYGPQTAHRATLQRLIAAWERDAGRTAPQPPAEAEPALPKMLPRWGVR
ncbi:MAG: hypothetical protein C0434_07970 [Xanthomonadaceae bacterium]|nr:hypothetical protein [Xanthomonadaceae bacterium]